MRTQLRQRGVTAAALLVAAAVLTACGSSADSGGSSGGGSTTGDPVKVGFANPVAGPLPYPASAKGAEAAVNYVNDELGGIGGHPIELVSCDTDGTPDTNVNCSNKFVEEKVSFVIDGVELASGAELPALNSAKIPTVGTIANNATANQSQTSFYYGPASQSFTVGPLYILKDQGVKSVAFAAGDDAPNHAYFEKNIIPVAKQLGLELSITWYPPSSPNWQVVAASMKSKNADVVGIAAGSEGGCTSLLTALRSAGYTGKVLLGSCALFIKDLGADKAKDVLTYSGTWLPYMDEYAPADVKDRLKIFTDQMNAINADSDINSQKATGVFSAIVTTVNALNQAKVTYPLSGETVSSTLRALKDFPTFLSTTVTCDGQQWPGTSSCINSIMLTTVTPQGTIKPITDPAFKPLDTSLLKVG